MSKISWVTTVIIVLLSFSLLSCGYVKKDEFEKRLSDQQITIEQQTRLAMESATKADDKAANAVRDVEKVKREVLLTVDQKVSEASLGAKEESIDTDGIRLIAEKAASQALVEAKSNSAAEAERIKQMAKQDADKAMAAAMEANRKAEEAARMAELAKELSKSGGGKSEVFTVYFDLGKSALKKEGIAELEKAANMIKNGSKMEIEIVGHADSTPFRSRKNNNWTLSENRAKTVRDYLVKDLNVPPESVKKCVGLAEYSPTALNDRENKWQNRRVEVIVKSSL